MDQLSDEQKNSSAYEPKNGGQSGLAKKEARGNLVNFVNRGSAEFPQLDLLERHWSELANTGTVPKRADVSPTRFEAALSFTFVAEKISKGTARLRVVGQHLNDLMGMDLRGMPLSALILPDSRSELAKTLDQVLSRPARARLRLRAPAGPGRPAIDGQMCLWPLRDDKGQITRILGGLASLRPPGTVPRRFLVRSTLVQHAHLQREPSEQARAFGEDQRDFAPRPQMPKQPELYIVRNDPPGI